MKPVHCSWVDMLAIRRSLGNGERGSQKQLGKMRCVDKSTLSRWQATCDILDAADGKVALPQLLKFQPTHALELARAFRRQDKPLDTKKSKAEIVKWIERVEDEGLTVNQFKKALVAQRRKEAEVKVAESDNDEIRCCSMQELLPTLSDVDAIITDPPYEKEFIPLYGELAKLARDCLTPNGILAVMCGQSYLPEIIHSMAEHVPYRWTMAYLTPGGQSVQLFPRKVNTFWKPVLLFGASRDWIGDVVSSDVNDNDKRFHQWGQSESGMARLVEQLTLPGQLVCDPFLGAGTTAMVSRALGRRFVGCDISPEHVAKTKERING